jgi:glycosyltransferase involved in cell wall biosynthesis
VKIAFVYPHLFFADSPSSLSDSIGILTYEMARRLAATCDVTVYARRGLGQPASDRYEGFACRRVIVTPDQLLTLVERLERLGIGDPRRPFFNSRWYYRGYVEQVARDLRRGGCDVVHLYSYPQLARVIRRHNPDARIVLQMGDHSLVQRDRALIAEQLRDVDLVVACSDHVAAAIRGRFPEAAERVRTVHHGVDEKWFADPEPGSPAGDGADASEVRSTDGKRVLYVGRISPEKGVHVLLEAFARVAAEHPDAVLELVGPEDVAPKQFVDPLDDDPRFDDLRSFYRRRGGYLEHLKAALAPEIAERVRFSGVVPYGDIHRRYARADVFVIPSLWNEPFGMPATEAMASGLPLVATRGGAFPEIVDEGTTGLLVEGGDAAGLADAISRLLADDGLRRRMGAAGRERARSVFLWERILERLVGLYEEILAEPQRRAAS